jgi:hypothetical protein
VDLIIEEQGQWIAYLSISKPGVLWATSGGPEKWRWRMSHDSIDVRVDTTRKKYAKGNDIVFNVYFKNVADEKVVFFKRKSDEIPFLLFEISKLDCAEAENKPVTAVNTGCIVDLHPGFLDLSTPVPISAPENIPAAKIEKKLVESGLVKIVLESGQEEKFTFRVSDGLSGLHPFWEMAPGKYRIMLCDFDKSVEVEISR